MGNVIQATSQLSTMGNITGSTTAPDLSSYLTYAQANQDYYTKSQSDSQYLTSTAGDTRYLTPASGDARYYTKQLSDARYALATSALQLDNPQSITPSIPLGSSISYPAKSPTELLGNRPNLPDGYYWYFAGFSDYQYINGIKQYDPMFSPVRLYTRFNMVDGKNWVRVFSAPCINPANVVYTSPIENYVGYNIPMRGFLMQQSDGTNRNYSYIATTAARPFNYMNNYQQVLSVGGNKPGFKICVGSANGHGFYISTWTSPSSIGGVASMNTSGPSFGSCLSPTTLLMGGVPAPSNGRFPDMMVWGTGNSTTSPTYTLLAPGTVVESWITW